MAHEVAAKDYVLLVADMFGAGYGVAKQTIVPAALGIVFALVMAVGPGIIDGIVTAVI